ncbi:MAG: SOS response-associated peptidase [Candidatus Marinimicrobia bacterium]|nr:SOS response-associated peptidase [Candidatus Neomarinimicrobiota bacterium]
MCGRKTLTKDKTEIIKEYLQNTDNACFEWNPSFNIAPSQQTPVLIYKGGRTIVPMQWGLIPFWAKDRSIGYKMINARSDRLTEKKSFAPLIKQQRCIVITDGYYEWKNTGLGKRPYFIFRKDRDFISMAGLWSQWQSDRDKIIHTYTVITTEPQQEIAHIHHRMPAIIPKDKIEFWINHTRYDKDMALKLLIPFEEKLNYYPVTYFVNHPANNSSLCLQRFESETPGLFLNHSGMTILKDTEGFTF